MEKALFNYVLGRHGYAAKRKASLEIEDYQITLAKHHNAVGTDELDSDVSPLCESCKPFLRTSVERLFALYKGYPIRHGGERPWRPRRVWSLARWKHGVGRAGIDVHEEHVSEPASLRHVHEPPGARK